MKSEISMWKTLPSSRGCKVLNERLIPFLLMPFQHESPLIRNRPDRSAHTVAETLHNSGREFQHILSFGEDFLLHFKVSASSILGRGVEKCGLPQLPCFRTSLVVSG